MVVPQDFFDSFEEAARADPLRATQPNAVFELVLSGEGGGSWTLDLREGRKTDFVASTDPPDPNASIHVAAADWLALTTGQMNPMRAFMAGKIRVDGDLKLAVHLPNVVNMVDGYGIGARSPLSASAARLRGAWSAVLRRRPAIEPMPPSAPGRLPWVGAGRSLIRDPTAFFNECRSSLGDTFVVDAFGYRLFCVFSPQGVRGLWRLPEDVASKALADLTLLSHKVPVEMFEGRRTLPHDLFARNDVEVYLDHLRAAVDAELATWGESGSVELFAFTKRLAHRMGLASWGGMSGASDEELATLLDHFETLDASESFVHPRRAFYAAVTRKRRERRAMRAIESTLAAVIRRHDQRPAVGERDLFSRICAAWSNAPSPEREVGIARDIAVVQMGSQSNLFAAMAWTLVFALRHPAIIEQVRTEGPRVLDSFSHEAIRMSQRSIVMRRVVTELELDDGRRSYRLSPGTLVTTMLSVTNTSAAPGLDRFDASHYSGATFLRADELPARELVTTYGHGKHTCPAHRFSTSAIVHAVAEVLQRYELEADLEFVAPLRRQIGGVARADRLCPVRYVRRS